MNQKADLATAILENIPWKTANNPNWPFTKFILRRNLARYFFPSKMNQAEAATILNSLKTAVLGFPEMALGYALKKGDLKPVDKELIVEHFMYPSTFESGDHAEFLLDPLLLFLISINLGNHLEFRHLDTSGDLGNKWDLLSKMESIIGNHFDFAFSPRFGYLTSDPRECGTALTILAYLHLPALVQNEDFPEIWSKQLNNDESLLFTGIAGDKDLIGDFVVVQNNFTLGVNEESIVRSIQSAASKLIANEKKLRSGFKKENADKIKNKISKAYGLLVHSYELDVKDALNLLSLMKLGLDLGWISAVEDKKLNELFFKVRRGHLAHLFPEVKEHSEFSHKRAEFLHQELKGIQIAI